MAISDNPLVDIMIFMISMAALRCHCQELTVSVANFFGQCVAGGPSGRGVLAYGDLKRVELAVALGTEPRVLLMDEPTAGMAPRERVELMGLAARLAHELDVAVLFTEHDMDIVFSHADRIIVLSRGELIAEGNAEEIRSDPLVLKTYLGEGQVYAKDSKDEDSKGGGRG